MVLVGAGTGTRVDVVIGKPMSVAVVSVLAVICRALDQRLGLAGNARVGLGSIGVEGKRAAIASRGASGERTSGEDPLSVRQDTRIAATWRAGTSRSPKLASAMNVVHVKLAVDRRGMTGAGQTGHRLANVGPTAGKDAPGRSVSAAMSGHGSSGVTTGRQRRDHDMFPRALNLPRTSRNCRSAMTRLDCRRPFVPNCGD